MNSSEAVARRVEKILDDLRTVPLPVKPPNETSLHYSGGVVGYEDVKDIMFRTTYAPHDTGRFLIEMLSDIERGDGLTAYISSSRRIFELLEYYDCQCSSPSGESVIGADLRGHQLSIACGDNWLENDTLDDMRAALVRRSAISSFGDMSWPRDLCS